MRDKGHTDTGRQIFCVEGDEMVVDASLLTKSEEDEVEPIVEDSRECVVVNNMSSLPTGCCAVQYTIQE